MSREGKGKETLEFHCPGRLFPSAPHEGHFLYIIRQKEERIMDKFIEREKMSKKARRELDRQRRVVWIISPVTRRADDKKKYSRKRRDQVREDL